jgi:hypothetical protein
MGTLFCRKLKEYWASISMDGLPTIESAPLNFASLYPTVMMAYNVSPDKLVHIDFEEGGGEDAGSGSRWVVFMDELED